MFSAPTAERLSKCLGHSKKSSLLYAAVHFLNRCVSGTMLETRLGRRADMRAGPGHRVIAGGSGGGAGSRCQRAGRGCPESTLWMLGRATQRTQGLGKWWVGGDVLGAMNVQAIGGACVQGRSKLCARGQGNSIRQKPGGEKRRRKVWVGWGQRTRPSW